MSDPLFPVRYLDLGVVVIALPVFIIAGFPLAGWGAGAGAWLLQRAINHWTTRRAQQADNVRATVGILTGSMIGRGWLVALTILAVGIADNDAGLAAAVLVVALFTVYFTASLILRPFDNHHHQAHT
jgi:hypothetical protein